jgi:hypothetical protein
MTVVAAVMVLFLGNSKRQKSLATPTRDKRTPVTEIDDLLLVLLLL